MIDDQSQTFAFYSTEDDEPLSGRDYFLDVMQIEPATGERLAERVRATFFQHGFKNFASAETHQSGLCHLAAQTNRAAGFFTRKPTEFSPIFVPAWIVPEQIADGPERKPA